MRSSRSPAACSATRGCDPLYGMRKVLVVFLAAVATLGLADCGGGKSTKSTPSTTTRPARSGSGAGAANAQGLSAYLKCLGQHGVNLKKVAAAKGSGGAGAALKKDPKFATASPTCKHFLG